MEKDFYTEIKKWNKAIQENFKHLRLDVVSNKTLNGIVLVILVNTRDNNLYTAEVSKERLTKESAIEAIAIVEKKKRDNITQKFNYFTDSWQ